MPTIKCSFSGCQSNILTENKLSFFKYPINDRKRCEQWVRNSENPKIGQIFTESLRQLRYRTVCEKHFFSYEIINYKNRKQLISTSVPKILISAIITDTGSQQPVPSEANKDVVETKDQKLRQKSIEKQSKTNCKTNTKKLLKLGFNTNSDDLNGRTVSTDDNITSCLSELSSGSDEDSDTSSMSSDFINNSLKNLEQIEKNINLLLDKQNLELNKLDSEESVEVGPELIGLDEDNEDLSDDNRVLSNSNCVLRDSIEKSVNFNQLNESLVKDINNCNINQLLTETEDNLNLNLLTEELLKSTEKSKLLMDSQLKTINTNKTNQNTIQPIINQTLNDSNRSLFDTSFDAHSETFGSNTQKPNDKQKRKSITIEEKIEIIKDFNSGMKRTDIMKKYSLAHQSNLTTILKNRDKYMEHIIRGNFSSIKSKRMRERKGRRRAKLKLVTNVPNVSECELNLNELEAKLNQLVAKKVPKVKKIVSKTVIKKSNVVDTTDLKLGKPSVKLNPDLNTDNPIVCDNNANKDKDLSIQTSLGDDNQSVLEIMAKHQMKQLSDKQKRKSITIEDKIQIIKDIDSGMKRSDVLHKYSLAHQSNLNTILKNRDKYNTNVLNGKSVKLKRVRGQRKLTDSYYSQLIPVPAVAETPFESAAEPNDTVFDESNINFNNSLNSLFDNSFNNRLFGDTGFQCPSEILDLTLTIGSDKQKRRSISIEDKIEIIKDIDNGMKRSDILVKYSLADYSNLNTILKNRDKYLSNGLNGNFSIKRKRMREGKYREVERELNHRIDQCLESDITITGTLLQDIAKEVAKKLNILDFKASNGWLNRYKKRRLLMFSGTGSKINTKIDDIFI